MTAQTNGPLATAILDAIAAATLAEQAYDACECDVEGDLLAASAAADAVVVAARDALIASEEEVEWVVSEEGHAYTTVWACSAIEALEIAVDDYDASCYGDVEGTFRIEIRVTNTLIDETDTDTITIDPTAPDCADGCEHDWQAPHSVVGGIRRNPGIRGSGHGGVRARCVCSHCGVYQVVDSGATDSSNGTRITATTYEDADDASLAWVADAVGRSRGGN